MNTHYCSLQSPKWFDLWIFYIKFCNNCVMTFVSISCAYLNLTNWLGIFLFLSNFNFDHRLCFRIDQKAKMIFIFGDFVEICNFGKKSKQVLIKYFSFLFEWVFFFWKTAEFWDKYFFDRSCSRIHKNWLTHKFFTTLEWDKCQQFVDFIKFVFISLNVLQ